MVGAMTGVIMRRRVLCGAVSLLLATTALAGCGGGEGADVPFTIDLAPEFVQGAIPGAASGVLVMISNESTTDASVALGAMAEGAEVAVEPDSIRAGEVAEVTVVADPATMQRPLDIVVTGRRGDIEVTVTKSTEVFPWEDDRGEYAGILLDVFTTWLAQNEAELGIDEATELSGSFVAPGLFVVSHYCYISEEWELGLSWHVMVPPDDWAEIYLRPRGEERPTLAFRLASQAAALEDGDVTISAVDPPLEVVR
jgi:hypothetical protein